MKQEFETPIHEFKVETIVSGDQYGNRVMYHDTIFKVNRALKNFLDGNPPIFNGVLE